MDFSLDRSCFSDCHEREEDSQAPPELEPINLGGFLYWQPKKEVVGAILKKNFLKDVYSKEISGYEQFQQQGMGGYGQDSGYEPSADELIEVLK